MKKLATARTSMALVLFVLFGFGNLAGAQEPKSKPATHCIEFWVHNNPYYNSWKVRNKCGKEFFIIRTFGFSDGLPVEDRNFLPPGGHIDLKKSDAWHDTKMPVWGAACEVSVATIASPEKRDKVQIGLDLDAGTFYCGENGKFGSGKAVFQLPEQSHLDY